LIDWLIEEKERGRKKGGIKGQERKEWPQPLEKIAACTHASIY